MKFKEKLQKVAPSWHFLHKSVAFVVDIIPLNKTFVPAGSDLVDIQSHLLKKFSENYPAYRSFDPVWIEGLLRWPARREPPWDRWASWCRSGPWGRPVRGWGTRRRRGGPRTCPAGCTCTRRQPSREEEESIQLIDTISIDSWHNCHTLRRSRPSSTSCLNGPISTSRMSSFRFCGNKFSLECTVILVRANLA